MTTKKKAAFVNIDPVAFIRLVRQHPILWDSREEDYKIAEKKPSVWEKISHTMNCEKCE